MSLTFQTLPAFEDNYLWLLIADNSNEAAVVDPGDATPVLTALDAQGLQLTTILVTHHHQDHTGGVSELVRKTGANVIGPASDEIPQVTQPVSEGAIVNVLGANFSVLEVPGHTLDHIAFYSVETGEAPWLFCGDTLFAGGCGRIFEGTPQQMLVSLEKLADLPPQTLVFCAHEYTQSNLRFASVVEPDNDALSKRVMEVSRLRESGLSTVPSVLATELLTNPFLRFDQPSLQAAVTRHNSYHYADKVATFAALRKWKDNF